MINAIADLNKYNTDMEKSMKDKTFFLDHIRVADIDAIVDFGCANGALLDVMPEEWTKYGIDNNPDMQKICKEKSYPVYDSLDQIKDLKARTLLNMSSVIHEVYSYLSPEEIAHFWDKVFDGSYEYITIRDMMLSENTVRPADAIAADIFYTNGKFNNEYANSFFKEWDINPYLEIDQADLLHYLLKYKYTDNWARENAECYIPISIEQLKALIPDTYEIVYEEEYVLPFLKEQVKKDFDYEIKDNTHIKLLLTTWFKICLNTIFIIIL